MSQKLIKTAMNTIEKQPPDAVNLFKEKYAELFKNNKLLETILKLPWSERTYKQICFLSDDIIPFISYRTNNYCQYSIYTVAWFHPYWINLPFEMYDSLAKEGIDLLKILLKEKKLDGYQKDRRYKNRYKKCETQVKALLKERTALSLLVKGKRDQNQYEKLMAFAHLIKDKLYYFNRPDPIFSLFQKYIYHWRKPYLQAIPFKDWEDLAKEGIDLLKELIDKDQLDKFEKNKKYISFFNQLNSHLKKISKVDPKQIQKNISGKNKVLLDTITKAVKYPESIPENFFLIQKRDFLIPFRNGEIIYELLKEKWSQRKYTALRSFAYVILSGISRRSPRICFDVPPIYNLFQEYIYEYDSITQHNRPFEVYVDTVKEQMDLLKTLYEEGGFDQYKTDKRFQAFYERYCTQAFMLVEIGYAYPEDEWDCQLYIDKSITQFKNPLDALDLEGHPHLDFNSPIPKPMAPDWRFQCFVNNYKNIFSNTQLLFNILNNSPGQKKYNRLIRLSGIINRALSAQRYCDKTHFKNILPIYDFFQEYIINTCMGLRMEAWMWDYVNLSKFDQELYSLFTELIKKNQCNKYKTNTKYVQFIKKYKPYIKKAYTSISKKTI